MSNRWPAGIIRKNPVTPAGPLQNGAASGVWSLADAAYWTKQGLWPLAGNTLAVEDVFSTYLYTGTGATQTITNGINLSGSGGMVWTKNRGRGTSGNLIDTVRGVTKKVVPSSTAAQATVSYMTSFDTTGYTINGNNDEMNLSADTYASWTFREQPNFFDVVTYTGTGANQNIAHNLGSVPGMILVKRTDTAADWQVYHRSNANTQYQVLNSTAAVATGTTRWNSTTPTATEFTVGTDTTVNASGGTYVAYLYAHDTASTGIIQCGSFTTDGSGLASVTLGYEPQWILVKRTNAVGNWILLDTMRGLNYSSNARLFADLADAESAAAGSFVPTATGFNASSFASSSFVYMAIRRGPMRTPTLGTSVFSPNVSSASTGTTITTNFPVDLQFAALRGGGFSPFVMDRLRGVVTSGTAATRPYLNTGSTAAETLGNSSLYWDNTGYQMPSGFASNSDVFWNFRRAPGFFDEVCYAGTGANRTVAHNLGVAPELMIVKIRDFADSWRVYYYPNSSMLLNGSNAGGTASAVVWNNTDPTSTVFSLGTNNTVNGSGATYVAYLFASCPGVSKVGSYTGNGSSQTINCAFTTGSRFVMIKRTDSTGDWYVWDSARGIVAGNDPYLALNTTAAEVTTNDSVDTDNTGFIVNQVAASNVNVNGGTYIFLAIA